MLEIWFYNHLVVHTEVCLINNLGEETKTFLFPFLIQGGPLTQVNVLSKTNPANYTVHLEQHLRAFKLRQPKSCNRPYHGFQCHFDE